MKFTFQKNVNTKEVILSEGSVFMVTDYMWSERERRIEHVTKVFIFGGWFYDDANNLGNIGW